MTHITLTGAKGRQIEVPTTLFINNEFTPSVNNATLVVENPTTGEPLANVSAASTEDVNRAVVAATEAFPAWKTTPGPERAAVLHRLADLIERDMEDFASIEALEGGILYTDSKNLNIPQTVSTLRYYAGWADKIDGKTLHIPGGVAYTFREPLGVCAAIVPWNAPLMITAWKIAPALTTGNTLLLKPSELTPLYSLKLAQLIREAGFPAGVINILPGDGPSAGAALSSHPSIRKLSFTGSTVAGRAILHASASSNLKQVSLELGGKGPSLVFADCDLANALLWTRIGITANNGQVCAAGSRIYVQRPIYERFLEAYARAAAENVPITGDPLEESTTKGPVASKAQFEKILEYIASGKQSGRRLLFGGQRVGEKGYFVQNTAFADVGQEDRIMQEEIFGPVAGIAPFDTEEDAIRLANDSLHGLSAAVFTNDINCAHRVTAALETGQVTVNAWALLSANAPFGGVKESGFGRDMGEEALECWTTVKTVKYSIVPRL
ncbi:putative aldehyde dehydrogenase [Aspergillus homomorphus CBS 101889]|uniref:aldehyde dehydrogenase (NAD(+)) n=1 Tax=Aspergillus homomorphus (strain CBS 101889) TaxID=1450537 RepID=A0A395I599_ASPHC|nr:aldehyde dehydrogenase [Aspergillus homomorphus CBS 101889]RAL14368.1 aldehyde dehydrogenase [Aspergillus homomorphus CBS 101889]